MPRDFRGICGAFDSKRKYRLASHQVSCDFGGMNPYILSRIIFKLVLPLFALLLVNPLRADQAALKSAAKADLQNKIVVLTQFNAESDIHFDQTGKNRGDFRAGSWASEGVIRITKVSFERNSPLQLQAVRVLSIFDTKECQFKNYVTDWPVTIDIDIDPASSVEELRAVLGKIILNDGSRLRDFVPDYWKPWLADKNVALNQQVKQLVSNTKGGHCAPPEANGSELSPAKTNVANLQLTGTLPLKPPHTPLKPLWTPDPEYSELARRAKLKGTTLLALVVDEKGNTRDIHIARPFGAGLDDQAVEAVRNWKFAPASKDGVPIAVQIKIEVSFLSR